jgi:acyl CoA:acetate/3-ketoacid CoA transferase alpha subunit
MNKVVASADAAIHDINDGATLMLGGFGYAVSLKIVLQLW